MRPAGVMMVVLVLARQASAEVAPPEPAATGGTMELVLGKMLRDSLRIERPAWLLFAQVAGTMVATPGARPAPAMEATAGGQIRIGSTLCPRLRAGALVLARGPDRAAQWDTSGETWVSSCLYHAERITAPSLQVAHDLTWQGRPALSTRPKFLRRPFTRQKVTVGGSPVDLYIPETSGKTSLFGVEVAVENVAQDDRDVTALSLETTVVECRPPGRHCLFNLPADELSYGTIAVVAVSGDEIEAVAVRVMLARVAGARVGHGYELDLALGIIQGRLFRIDHARTEVAEESGPAFDVAIARPGRSLDWRVAYVRDLFSTMDQEIAVEDRVTVTVALGRVELAAWLAHTLLVGEDGRRADATGGVSARLDVALGRGLDASLLVEVARSHYATLDGDAAATPGFGARALGMITARIGSDR